MKKGPGESDENKHETVTVNPFGDSFLGNYKSGIGAAHRIQ